MQLKLWRNCSPTKQAYVYSGNVWSSLLIYLEYKWWYVVNWTLPTVSTHIAYEKNCLSVDQWPGVLDLKPTVLNRTLANSAIFVQQQIASPKRHLLNYGRRTVSYSVQLAISGDDQWFRISYKGTLCHLLCGPVQQVNFHLPHEQGWLSVQWDPCWHCGNCQYAAVEWWIGIVTHSSRHNWNRCCRTWWELLVSLLSHGAPVSHVLRETGAPECLAVHRWTDVVRQDHEFLKRRCWHLRMLI